MSLLEKPHQFFNFTRSICSICAICGLPALERGTQTDDPPKLYRSVDRIHRKPAATHVQREIESRHERRLADPVPDPNPEARVGHQRRPCAGAGNIAVAERRVAEGRDPELMEE